jgi:hypothetical protein
MRCTLADTALIHIHAFIRGSYGSNSSCAVEQRYTLTLTGC